MKDQLSIRYSYDQGKIVKISKSKKLKDDLENHGIYAWFSMYRGRETGYFFSTKMKVLEIDKIVNDLTRFDMSIFSLKSKQLNKFEN